MEDRHILASPWHQTAPHTHLAAVFDGHRGSAAACFLEAHFAHTLWQHRGSDAPTALKVVAPLQARCPVSNDWTGA